MIFSRLRTPYGKALILCALPAICVLGGPGAAADDIETLKPGPAQFLAQPFLQLPTPRSVNVVWLTNVPGVSNTLYCGERQAPKAITAETQKLSRFFEDSASKAKEFAQRTITEIVRRPVYRHEATCADLAQNTRTPYRVETTTRNGEKLVSDWYSLQPEPTKGTPLKILLTSDLQNGTMAPANYQKALETAGQFDLVLFSGDYVSYPRRGSEWFDQFDPNWAQTTDKLYQPLLPRTRPAFFPALNGTFQTQFPEFPYRGAPILQNTVMMGAIGNHEVSGRFLPGSTIAVGGRQRPTDLRTMFNDPQPRWYAAMQYEQKKAAINPQGDPAVKAQWIRDHSYDSQVHYTLWSHPEGPDGESYYAFSYGDAYVIVMNVSRIWRTWNIRPVDRSKFTERQQDANAPDRWGFGEFHFERFDAGSKQYRWLEKQLRLAAFKAAKYKIVLAHQSVFGLGDNAVPVHSEPVMHLDYRAADGTVKTKVIDFPADEAARANVFTAEVAPLIGRIKQVRYSYPLEKDIWRNDVEPLLVKHGVQLVHTGHSHLWNRSKVGTLNYLETSNVANTFGGYWQPEGGPATRLRAKNYKSLWAAMDDSTAPRWNRDDFPQVNDPHGRPAIFPTLMNPDDVIEGSGTPRPYLASNRTTVFS